MLERYAAKVARTVLRGGSGSNATPLPDQQLSWVSRQLLCFLGGKRGKLRWSTGSEKAASCGHWEANYAMK
jgi:hypothetical protein